MWMGLCHTPISFVRVLYILLFSCVSPSVRTLKYKQLKTLAEPLGTHIIRVTHILVFWSPKRTATRLFRFLLLAYLWHSFPSRSVDLVLPCNYTYVYRLLTVTSMQGYQDISCHHIPSSFMVIHIDLFSCTRCISCQLVTICILVTSISLCNKSEI